MEDKVDFYDTVLFIKQPTYSLKEIIYHLEILTQNKKSAII